MKILIINKILVLIILFYHKKFFIVGSLNKKDKIC